MAQGTIKKSTKAAAPKAIHSKRKASKVGKPNSSKSNKASAASLEKAHKKFTSGMVAKTEALLGERAGHLELIGKPKKGGKKELTIKGGSKKFG